MTAADAVVDRRDTIRAPVGALRSSAAIDPEFFHGNIYPSQVIEPLAAAQARKYQARGDLARPAPLRSGGARTPPRRPFIAAPR
jgi:hypothetical protein